MFYAHFLIIYRHVTSFELGNKECGWMITR